ACTANRKTLRGRVRQSGSGPRAAVLRLASNTSSESLCPAQPRPAVPPPEANGFSAAAENWRSSAHARPQAIDARGTEHVRSNALQNPRLGNLSSENMGLEDLAF